MHATPFFMLHTFPGKTEVLSNFLSVSACGSLSGFWKSFTINKKKLLQKGSQYFGFLKIFLKRMYSCIKTVVPAVFIVNCVIYKQHLIAKYLSGWFNKFLSTIVTERNKIKTHHLNSRLSRQLCAENEENFKFIVTLNSNEPQRENNTEVSINFFQTVVEEFSQDSNSVL